MRRFIDHRSFGPTLTALACALPMTAWAQAEPQPPTRPAAAPADSLQEIVVTSLRRSTNLIEAPAAVQAFTSADIESRNITRPRDFLNQTPNVTLVETNHAGEAFIVIRGEAPARNAESSVAVVIDGVQQPSANEFNSDLFDIQQIEVLKGPQGALYGRNAVGGAIVITTKQPTNTYEGQVTAGIANGPAEKLQGSIGGPIVEDKLLFKLDASYRNTNGYRRNVNTGEHPDRDRDLTGRGLVVWTPWDGTRVDFRVEGTDLSGGGIAFNPQLDQVLQGLITDPHDQGYTCLAHIDSNNLCVPFVARVRSYDRQNKDKQSIKFDQDIGFGKIVDVLSRSFIRDIYGAAQFPYTFGQVPVFNPAPSFHQTQWVYLDNDGVTNELKYVSPDDEPLRGVGGVYLLHEQSDRKTNIRNDDDATLPSGQHPQLTGIDSSNSYRFDRTKNDVYAFFVNLDYDILDDLTATAAFRYDHESRAIHDLAPAPYSLFPGQGAKATYSKPQPKVSLKYKFDDDHTVYVTYAEGFKSGGFNPFNSRLLALRSDPNTVIQDQYPKESTRDWEIGFHSRWFDRRLSVDGAAFLSRAKNAQVFEFFPIPSLQANAAVDNALKRGFELNAAYVIAPGLTANVGYGYSLATISQLQALPALDGKRLPYSPLYQIDAGLQYSTALDRLIPVNRDDLTVTARVDYQRLGNTWWDIYNTAGTQRAPVDLVNARIAVDSENWTVAIWGKNINDAKYISETVVLNALINVVYPAQPATYGLDVTYRF